MGSPQFFSSGLTYRVGIDSGREYRLRMRALMETVLPRALDETRIWLIDCKESKHVMTYHFLTSREILSLSSKQKSEPPNLELSTSCFRRVIFYIPSKVLENTCNHP